ncbi:MAG: asparagine synthase (glutamine-hydrolyzing) [Bacteroidia bacterium]
MCGIVGFIDFTFKSNNQDLKNMLDTLSHRGPDDKGYECYKLNSCLVGFAQARLSIIDLSEKGHQPMHFNQYSIVFNGEIYNYNEIKEELLSLGHYFMSTTDTEVILHAYSQWGEKFVDKFIGMFIIAILNKESEEVIIYRDRAGVKPLFLYENEFGFLFASELKAFHKHPFFNKELDISSVQTFFNLGYIPAPYSIFKNCFKLKPGHYLKFNLKSKITTEIKYWDLIDYYLLPKLNLSYLDAKKKVLELLESACNYRMISDVPVGIFLSGGYDSSGVCAILQKNQTEKIKTFTIGFHEGINEAQTAKKIAEKIGTEHHEYYCTSDDAKELIKDLPYYYDEPNADVSNIPTMLVSKFASQYVKVVISADGGDEIFGGYNSYKLIHNTNKLLNKIPDVLKPFLKKQFNRPFNHIINNNMRYKLQYITQSLSNVKNIQSLNLYKTIHTIPNYYNNQIFNQEIPSQKTFLDIDPTAFDNEIDIAMLIDYKNPLPSLLEKVDRATMKYSVEGRDPLIDHRLAEFLAQLPIEFKNDGINSKIIFKDIVNDILGKELMERPKIGFDLPIHTWLKNDLKDLFNDNCSIGQLKKSNIFNLEFIEHQLKDYQNNKLHFSPFIWRLFTFQMWYNKWMI